LDLPPDGGSVSPVPKHRLDATLRQGAADFNRMWDQPPPRDLVGNSLHHAHVYPGQRILYTRNARYWKVDSGKRLPYLAGS
jgi:hypothetical protein